MTRTVSDRLRKTQLSKDFGKTKAPWKVHLNGPPLDKETMKHYLDDVV